MTKAADPAMLGSGSPSWSQTSESIKEALNVEQLQEQLRLFRFPVLPLTQKAYHLVVADTPHHAALFLARRFRNKEIVEEIQHAYLRRHWEVVSCHQIFAREGVIATYILPD